MKAFRQDGLWGGNRIYVLNDIGARLAAAGISSPFSFSLSSLLQQAGPTVSKILSPLGYAIPTEPFLQAVEGVVEETEEKDEDLDSQLWVAVAYIPKYAALMGNVHLAHAKTDIELAPKVFEKWLRPAMKEVKSWEGKKNISQMMRENNEIQVTPGSRYV